MSHEWSEDKMIRLIELIRDRPLIWNAESEDYKKRHKRTNAFGEVADCIGVQREEVERKWKVLQTQFRREHSKAAAAAGHYDGQKCAGAGAGTLWFGYKHMSFLKDRNFTRNGSGGQTLSRTSNNHQEGTGTAEYSTRPETSSRGDKRTTSSSSCNSKETVTVKREAKRESPKRKRLKRFGSNYDYPLNFDVNSDDTYAVSDEKSAASDKRTTPVRWCSRCNNNISSRDEAAVYGEYVANKLRKYDMFVRADVEHKINCALHEADLKSIQHRLWQTQQSTMDNRRQDGSGGGHGVMSSVLIQQASSAATAAENSYKCYDDRQSPPTERSPSVLSVASSTSFAPQKLDKQEL